MRLSLRLTLALLALALATPAVAQDVHSVWSDTPLAVRDGDTDTWLTPTAGNSASGWQEGTPQAFVNAQAQAGGNSYEFRLVALGSSTGSEITGLWDVYRNGSLLCASCVGVAYGLDQAAGVGNYFKIYIGDPLAYAEDWHFSGYITNRSDY